jgi:hypothetical protein
MAPPLLGGERYFTEQVISERPAVPRSLCSKTEVYTDRFHGDSNELDLNNRELTLRLGAI